MSLQGLEITSNGPRCNLCNIVCTSRENALQHLIGKKHQKKRTRFELEQLLKTTTTGSPSSVGLLVDVQEPIATVSKSRMRLYQGVWWYVCDICNKRLNTETQLAIHKRSHPKIVDVSLPMVGSGAQQTTSRRIDEARSSPKRANATAAETCRSFYAAGLDDVITIRKGEKLPVRIPKVNRNKTQAARTDQ